MTNCSSMFIEDIKTKLKSHTRELGFDESKVILEIELTNAFKESLYRLTAANTRGHWPLTSNNGDPNLHRLNHKVIVSNEDQVAWMAEFGEIGKLCYAEVTNPPQMLTHYQLLLTHYTHPSKAEWFLSSVNSHLGAQTSIGCEGPYLMSHTSSARWPTFQGHSGLLAF